MNNQTIPDWYYNPLKDGALESTPPYRRAGLPVRKTLADLGKTLAREFSTPPCAESWMGKLDPRAKVLGLFALVFACTALHSLWSLSAVLVLILVLSASIRAPVRGLLRLWVGVPLFSMAIILPATTNLVTHGSHVLTFVHFGHPVAIGPWLLPESIALTDAGLVVAGRFLLRSTNCIALMYLLVASTGPAALFDGLRRLGMPRVFGMVLAMAHRYVAVMLQAAQEIHLSRLSRTIFAGSMQGERRWIAAGMGVLFRKTHKLAYEVHNAMIARGYDGLLRTKTRGGLSTGDIAWTIAALGLAAALVAGERALTT